MTEPDFLVHTRKSYDAVSEDYAEWAAGELAVKPLDRAMLAAFAELVTGPVADIGCGTGRVTAHLAGLGVSAFGIDLSPGMIAVARKRYPELRFATGSMLELDLADGELGGIIAWYSTIHVPDPLLPQAFAEFRRVLAPGGNLQLAFQAGTGVRPLTSAGRHEVCLDFHRRQPEQVSDLLREAGFAVRALLVREPDEDGEFPELTPQAFLLARVAENSSANSAAGS